MGIPPNIRHILFLVVTCTTAVFGVLKVQPEFQTAAWVAAVGSVLAVLGAIFTDTPAATRAKMLAKTIAKGSVGGLAVLLVMGATAGACAPGTGPGPVPGPVITDFAQLVSCVVQNIGSWESLLLQCGQWTVAEIVAAIDWLFANPKAQAEYHLTPDQLATLHAAREKLAAKLLAGDGGAR